MEEPRGFCLTNKFEEINDLSIELLQQQLQEVARQMEKFKHLEVKFAKAQDSSDAQLEHAATIAKLKEQREEKDKYILDMELKLRDKDRELRALQINNEGLKKAVAAFEEKKERDWRNLHPELLHLISKKTENFSNFIRFRAVCREWRSATDPTDSPPPVPCLIWPVITPLAQRCTIYNLYSPSSNTHRQINIPINNHLRLDGSSTGFILAYSSTDHSAFLLNPLTGTKVSLPYSNFVRLSTACINGRNPNRNSSSGETEIYCVIRTYKYPSTTLEIEYFRISQPDRHITFPFPCHALSSTAYFEGKIFLSVGRVTWVYDATTGTKVSVEIPHPDGHAWINYLIEVMGDLLAVVQSCIDQTSLENQFEVYRLNHTYDFGFCEWTKLEGIGDRILFLQESDYGFCLRASDIKGLRGNHIYFRRRICYGNDPIYNDDGCVRRYDLEDGTTQVLTAGPISATWFLPSLS